MRQSFVQQTIIDTMLDNFKHVGVTGRGVLTLCDPVIKVFELFPKLVNALKVFLNFCNFLNDGFCVSGRGVIALGVDLLGNLFLQVADI